MSSSHPSKQTGRGGGRRTRDSGKFGSDRGGGRGRRSYQQSEPGGGGDYQVEQGARRSSQSRGHQTHPKQPSQGSHTEIDAMQKFFQARTADLYKEINKQANTKKPFYRGLIVLSSSKGTKDVQATKDLSQMLGVSEKPTLLERLSQE